MMHRREAQKDSPVSRTRIRIRPVAIITLLVILAGMIQPRSQSQIKLEGPNTLTIRMQDADEPMGAVGKRAMREANKRLILDRQKQMTNDSVKLLRLATDLKVEVDGSNQHTLSTGTMRKADEIAKLAHDVREKMKLTFPY
jgi:hypothetical protein